MDAAANIILSGSLGRGFGGMLGMGGGHHARAMGHSLDDVLNSIIGGHHVPPPAIHALGTETSTSVEIEDEDDLARAIALSMGLDVGSGDVAEPMNDGAQTEESIAVKMETRSPLEVLVALLEDPLPLVKVS